MALVASIVGLIGLLIGPLLRESTQFRGTGAAVALVGLLFVPIALASGVYAATVGPPGGRKRTYVSLCIVVFIVLTFAATAVTAMPHDGVVIYFCGAAGALAVATGVVLLLIGPRDGRSLAFFSIVLGVSTLFTLWQVI